MKKILYNPFKGIGYTINDNTSFQLSPLKVYNQLNTFLKPNEIGLFYECLYTSYRLINQPLKSFKEVFNHELRFISITPYLINNINDMLELVNHFLSKLSIKKQQGLGGFLNLLLNNRHFLVILNDNNKEQINRLGHNLVQIMVVFNQDYDYFLRIVSEFGDNITSSFVNENVKKTFYDTNQYYEIDYYNNDTIIDFKTYTNNEVLTKQNINQINHYEYLIKKYEK